jgi:hypothetical protein
MTVEAEHLPAKAAQLGHVPQMPFEKYMVYGVAST